MGRKARAPKGIDTELDDLPPKLRWRVWMGRVEAVIFASPTPVTREALARVVGQTCHLDDLLDDIRAELLARPYELVAVAGGWQLRTKKVFADAIRLAAGIGDPAIQLSPLEAQILTAIAYFQPVTRNELCTIFGREIGRDVVADLRSLGLVASGPRSPTPGAPYTYVTTDGFLSTFGLSSLHDLPERQQLEVAGLLTKESLLSGELHEMFGLERDGEEEPDNEDVPL